MYTWLNKRSVLVLNISNKERKKLTTLLVQIDRRRSQVEGAQFCSPPAPCKNELAYLHDTNNSRDKTASSIHFKSGFNLIKLLNFVAVQHPAKMSQLAYLHDINDSRNKTASSKSILNLGSI